MSNFILRWFQDRELKTKLAPLHAGASLAQDLAERYKGDSKEALQQRLAEIRSARINEGAHFDVEQWLPHVFAIVSALVERVLGVKPYSTQVLAGLALYRGYIAEMGTGEGKTLTAPFAAAAHWALHGRKVHVCTANDYLAQRDATIMLPLYRAMGMTAGVTRADQSLEIKAKVYSADVVYGTHKALAQDYLTENLNRFQGQSVMPRQLGAVIVDEADAALIDDARMPIVLSASMPSNGEMYTKLANLAESLVRGQDAQAVCDFYVDPKDRLCVLTEQGYERATQGLHEAGLLGAGDEVYGETHQALLHKLCSALAARHLHFKDQHYVVRDGAIVLVDDLTGRLNAGQRWDSGLHQALEAKEGLVISPEAVTLARITLQHFFRQYEVLSGMTGTAMDDADELQKVYGALVVAIPLNKPSQRIDEAPRFYRTQAAKMDAVIEDIVQAHQKGQPVLIGTASVEQSAQLSARLSAAGLAHEVLNATQHDREAEIIAGAGARGAITVSTSMAGRGVDIVLGGSVQLLLWREMQRLGEQAWMSMTDEQRQAVEVEVKQKQAAEAEQVRAAGGLRVIGLERHDSRRQDRQLRGRCARQGDPGQTVFYLSLEDQLVENFAGEKIRGIFMLLDVQPGEEFEAALVLKAVDGAQREVEGRAEAARRSLMEFEGVLDSQRSVIYGLRDEVLHGQDLEELLERLVSEEVLTIAQRHLPNKDFQETWDIVSFRQAVKHLGLELAQSNEQLLDMEFDDLVALVTTQAQSHRILRLDQVPQEQQAGAMRFFTLSVLDRLWMLHLDALDQIRRGIHLRSAAQTDPRRAYAKEAFELFSGLIDDLRSRIVQTSLTWVAQQKAPAEQAAVADQQA